MSPSIERRVVDDGPERITGRFPFAVDRRVPGMVHAAVVRGSVPHARIVGIRVEAAAAAPSVLAVITGADVHDELGDRMFHGESRQDQPVLAWDRIRYAGEPVALVVAETRAAADAAAELVRVDCEEYDFVTDEIAASAPDAPQLHDDWTGNDCGDFTLIHGDAASALDAAEFVHTEVYRSPAANHAALEPFVSIASWSGPELEVWTGTQAPYAVRRRLSEIFGLDLDQVRVRVDNLGGAFGSKLDLRLEAMAAIGARRVARPVRIELCREEMFLTSSKHSAHVRITTGADADGYLVGRSIEIAYNAGAYALTTPRAIRSGMVRSPGPYRIPHVHARARGYYTNTVPTGPFRGAMTGQVCWAHESALDELAHQMGMDPLEMRRRNLLRDGDTYATGEVMQEMRYVQLLDAVADGIGWDTPLRRDEDDVARGRGLAVVLKSTRTPSRSEASVVLGADGRISVRTSSIEMGQGAHRTFVELTARVLDADPRNISVTVVDTRHTPFDTTTSSSRTTLSMGTAIERAAYQLRAEIDKRMAEVFGASVEFRHADGVVANAAGDVLAYREIVERFGEISGKGEFESPPEYGILDPVTAQGLHTVSWHQGAVAVEVEVDTLTGHVRVTRAHGAVFAGRVVDPDRVRKQIEGGMIFGLGQALMEEVVYDSGEVVNRNFSEYQIPSILDVPAQIGSTVVADDDPQAPFHGVGENTVPPMAPAIANAIFDAVGVRVRTLPLTAERVLRALRDREKD